MVSALRCKVYTVDEPRGLDARRAWAALSSAEQNAVLQEAKAGRPHPDPDVRVVARAWARWLLGPTLWAIVVFLAVVGGAGLTLMLEALNWTYAALLPYAAAFVLVLALGNKAKRPGSGGAESEQRHE